VRGFGAFAHPYRSEHAFSSGEVFSDNAPGPADTTTVQAAVTAFNRGDVDGYLSRFDPDCRRWVVGFEDPLDLAAIEDNLRQMAGAFEPLTLTAESLFGADGQVCARWRLQGTQVGAFLGIPASGRTIDLRTCEVYELRDGVVQTVWTYGDPLDIVRQLTGGNA
jgi:steroid delta-isomerase-like uncharacterized protein